MVLKHSDVRHVNLIIKLIMLTTNGICQSPGESKPKEFDISFGTFNTINANKNVSINPAIAGYYGDYHFENRYNYEAANSASINVGRRIFKKIKNVEILPMTGLIFGNFKGMTLELQTSTDQNKWTFSTDSQFSFEYTKSDKSLYLNWTVARLKVTRFFHIGLTSVLDKHVNQQAVFDKGITTMLIFGRYSLRCYAFNYEKEKRYFWLSIRYTTKLRSTTH